MTGMRRWIVAGLLVLAGAALHAQPVSFADLARHDQYGEVKISPDGEYLAATAVVKGQTVLALIHLADKKGNVVRPRGEDDVISFHWVSPTRVVYAVGTRLGGYDSPLATGELFAVNADGTGADTLYGYRVGGMTTGSHIQHAVSERGTADFIAAIPDDPNHMLVSISAWDASGFERDLPVAYRMDVRDGVKNKVATAPMRGVTFVADHQGRIRFAYAEANDGSARVYQYPINGGDWQLMQKRSDERSFPWTFSRDDSVVYFTCPPSTGGFGVCTWNPAKDLWNTVWSNPNVEPSSLMQGIADEDIIGVGFMDGRPGVGLFEGHQADAQALIALMKQFPGESVRFTSGTRDGRLSVVLVQADADPGTFYLYDHATRKLSALLARASWINPEQMASKQPFEFAARDGLKLHGYVSYPPGEEDAKHLPLVVFVHGGPYGVQDSWNFDPYVQAMATRGYAVLQVNYRGSGGRGYAFMHAGWGEWGGKMQDDVTDATRWAIAQGIADPQRICIFGGSYGGYAALEGAVKEPDLYKCAIGYVGVYDLALMYRRGDIPQSSFGASYLKQVLGENMTALARRSPINQLDRLKAHVMLVVGGKDMRVPPIQGSNLHVALNNRHVPHVWIDKPNEMHGFYDEGNLTELYTQIVQFLGANIGAGVTAKSTAASTAPSH
jgi:dipeptidyl aminopeptidase/acylaminoacyl peptidase